MSTTALWKLLEVAFDHPNADGALCRAARDELVEIEEACQTLADWGVVHELLQSKEPEVDAAADHLYAIGHAKTEKQEAIASECQTPVPESKEEDR